MFNISLACLDRATWKRAGVPPLTFVDAAMRPQAFGYDELAGRVEAMAKGLQALGVKKGDRVLLQFPNTPDFPVSFFGVMRLGAIAVPVSRYLTSREMEVIRADSGARLVITDPRPIEARARGVMLPAKPTDENDPAYLVYTSGTTAVPKGVLHAHRALLGREPATSHWLGLEAGDVVLHSGDVNWTYTLGTGLMDPWQRGVSTIMYEGPKRADVWIDLIRRLKPSVFISVPAVYRQILEKTQAQRDDLSSLKRAISAGDTLPASVHENWSARFGVPLYDGLGLSECSYFVSNQVGMEVRPGSCGKPQPGRSAVLLDDGEEVIKGEGEGRLAVDRSDPALMLGYWKNGETPTLPLQEKWFVTGDICYRDSGGYFWYRGRDDDIINALGCRISPVEVEEVLNAYDGVAESAAVGIDFGEAKTLLVAFVVADPAAVSSQSLLQHCSERLARYKVPKEIRFVESLPRTVSGKLYRRLLKMR